MNRAEYRRQKRQAEKGQVRRWITEAEIENTVKDRLFRAQKRMIEEYNAEFIARDAEVKNQLINLLHRLWLAGLGEYGITDRELTYNLDQFVKRKFKQISEYISMGESDAAREMLAEIGVEASIIGLAEKHWRAEPDEEIVIDLEEEE